MENLGTNPEPVVPNAPLLQQPDQGLNNMLVDQTDLKGKVEAARSLLEAEKAKQASLKNVEEAEREEPLLKDGPTWLKKGMAEDLLAQPDEEVPPVPVGDRMM